MTTLWQWLVGLPGPVLGGVVLVGAFLSALGSFLVLARQSRISEGIRTQVEENLGRTEENLKQTQEVINRIEQAIAHITGGNSFCYVDFLLSNPPSNTPRLIILQQGDYPVYDVGIRIVDLEKFDLVKGNLTWEAKQQTETIFSIGTIGSQHSMIREPWPLPRDKDQQRYNVFISHRYGHFDELLRLRRVNGKWTRAIKVRKLVGREYVDLHEVIDATFPRDASGQVEW
jgi:hypothetical protein